MKLTVDKNGNDATSADFDPDEHRPVGLRRPSTWTTTTRAPRRALFGAGSLLGDDGKAVIPDSIAQGAKWFNDGVWKDHFIPTANQIASDLLARRQRVRLRQPRHQRGPHLVHLLRHTRRPARSRSSSASPCSRPSTARPRTAPRRHVQHPQDHQGPGRRVQGPDRDGRLPGAAHRLRRDAGRLRPSSRPGSTRSTPTSPDIKLDWDVAQGDARLPGHPQPSVLRARLRQVRSAMQAFGNSVSDDSRARHRRRARRSSRRPSRASSTPRTP